MSANDRLCIGIDLGGTNIKAALGRSRAEPLWTTEVRSDSEGGRRGVEAALVGVATLAVAKARDQGQRVHAVCVGTPGIIDPNTGRVLAGTANLPDWANADLPRLFGERLQLPVLVENDANVAAFAEATWGAGQGARHVVMITVGTGIGGGAVVDGVLLRGTWGAAMEVGHAPMPAIPGLVEGELPVCTCGRHGCIEAYVGGWALRRQWAAVRSSEGDVDPESVTVRDLIEHARAGSAAARNLLDVAARRLGHGLRAVVQILDPQLIVLGGGVVDGYPDFVAHVTDVLAACAEPGMEAHVAVRPATFGNRAGTLGAIALASLYDVSEGE